MKFSPSQKLNVLVLALAICTILAPKSSFAASTLVIDEFRVDSLSSTKEEYVVIANYGATDVVLSQYAFTIKTSNTNYQYLYRFLDTGLIKKDQKLKICYPTMITDKTCDLFYTISATSDYEMKQSGVLALINIANAKENVDVVGYGEIDYGLAGCWVTGCERYPLDQPLKNTPYKRRNGQDTDNSAMDFEAIMTPISVDPNAARIVISELLPNPSGGEEWFELYNPTNLNISLANLKICDALGVKHCYYFDKIDFLSAGAYKIYGQSLTKITLNNSGDWLELYDLADNLLADSGGNYGAADKGVSFALFGSEYLWTKTFTPGAQNIFTDTIEVEPEATAKPKTTVKKTAIVKKKSADTVQLAETDVKGAESPQIAADSMPKPLMSRKILGWSLIGLAVLLVISYTLWYFRDYAKKIYDKIRHRDDSARF